MDITDHPSQITTQFTHGFLFVHGYQSDRAQQELFVGYPEIEMKVWSRTWTGTDWTAWQYITYNIPSFYKDYNDLASLASGIYATPLAKQSLASGASITVTIGYRVFAITDNTGGNVTLMANDADDGLKTILSSQRISEKFTIVQNASPRTQVVITNNYNGTREVSVYLL